MGDAAGAEWGGVEEAVALGPAGDFWARDRRLIFLCVNGF
jgi:hypothetical protein